MTASPTPHPAAGLELPTTGRGSPAPWSSRLAGLLIDWAASLIVAAAFFGIAALQGHGWQMWTPLLTYFVEKSAFTAIAGGSFGQLIAGVGVMRTDGRRLSVGLSIARSALVCLVIPAVVIGPNRRGLHDVLLGTIPVKTR